MNTEQGERGGGVQPKTKPEKSCIVPVTTLGDKDPIPFLSSVSDSVIISCRVEKNDNSDIVPKLKKKKCLRFQSKFKNVNSKSRTFFSQKGRRSKSYDIQIIKFIERRFLLKYSSRHCNDYKQCMQEKNMSKLV